MVRQDVVSGGSLKRALVNRVPIALSSGDRVDSGSLGWLALRRRARTYGVIASAPTSAGCSAQRGQASPAPSTYPRAEAPSGSKLRVPKHLAWTSHWRWHGAKAATLARPGPYGWWRLALAISRTRPARCA